MAIYAIGDVQGCFEELEALIGSLPYSAARDRFWFVGDLVNRGPQSLEVLRLVRALGDKAVVVLGNHDLHLVARGLGSVRARKDDTLDEVLGAPDTQSLIDWLRTLPLLHVDGSAVMVHAGLLPQWSVAQAASLAREVQAALSGPEHREFVARLYGSRPDRWSDTLEGADRLRVIVNAMTRMRFCTDDGVMDFHAKGETSAAPPGYGPWFDVPGRASAGAAIICGHWSALGLKLRPDLVAIDTGCVWGGSLTAVRLDDRKVFQVPCRIEKAV